MGPSSPGLDGRHWRSAVWLDNLLGLQHRERLGGRSRSELAWGLRGVHRNWEQWAGHGSWRSRGWPLRCQRRSCGLGMLAGVGSRDQLRGAHTGSRSLAGPWCAVAPREQGVGEPHGRLRPHIPPLDGAPGPAVDAHSCHGEHQSPQEHQWYHQAYLEAPRRWVRGGQQLCTVGRGPARVAVALVLVVAHPMVVAPGRAVSGSVNVEVLAESFPANLL